MHDPRDGAAVLGLDDQHEAPPALGDDVVLQVPGGVRSPQVRVERTPQTSTLFSKPVSRGLECRAGIVDYGAGLVGLDADLEDFLLEGATPLKYGPQSRKRAIVCLCQGAPHGLNGREEIGQTAKLIGFEGLSLDRQVRQDAVEIGGGLQRERCVCLHVPHALAGGGQRDLGPSCIGKWLQVGEPGHAERRQCEALNGLDDPVELERPERAFVHAGEVPIAESRSRFAAENRTTESSTDIEWAPSQCRTDMRHSAVPEIRLRG